MTIYESGFNFECEVVTNAQLADSAGAPVEDAALADVEARITSAYGTVSVRTPHVPLLGD